jgi:uncharacterized membrane protein
MLSLLLQTFFISLAPLGEARVGIPFGMLHGLNPIVVYLVGTMANLLVFSLFSFLLDNFDQKLWKYPFYRRRSVNLIRRAKQGMGLKIQKYGFWGLMVFVMIPLPFTGAYMGVVAARVLTVKRSSAFKSITIGIIISSTLIAMTTYLGMLGVKLL